MWKEIRKDGLPPIGQQVLLASINRHRSSDDLGCCKDVGVLSGVDGCVWWSTHGEVRAMMSEYFTHWMPISDPSSDAGDAHGS